METKGLTCKIPLDLHNRISEEIRETGSTLGKFIEKIIREHYEKGAIRVMARERTLAFQVSEELFRRVKEYLERFERIYNRRLTQKEFVIGLIEQALDAVEEGKAEPGESGLPVCDPACDGEADGGGTVPEEPQENEPGGGEAAWESPAPKPEEYE